MVETDPLLSVAFYALSSHFVHVRLVRNLLADLAESLLTAVAGAELCLATVGGGSGGRE